MTSFITETKGNTGGRMIIYEDALFTLDYTCNDQMRCRCSHWKGCTAEVRTDLNLNFISSKVHTKHVPDKSKVEKKILFSNCNGNIISKYDKSAEIVANITSRIHGQKILTMPDPIYVKNQISSKIVKKFGEKCSGEEELSAEHKSTLRNGVFLVYDTFFADTNDRIWFFNQKSCAIHLKNVIHGSLMELFI